jgi:hypothetical protein
MMDQKRVQEAMASGLSFVCATCENWYKGVDAGLKDGDGDAVCLEYKTCFSPLSGGGFEKYQGPIKGYLIKFCYMCGKKADKAVEAKGSGDRIGICSSCLEVLKNIARREAGRNILFTTERRAGENKYVELK